MADDDPTSEPGPRPLEYRRPGLELPGTPRVSAAGQAGLGFVAWLAAVGAWVAACFGAQGNGTVVSVAGGAVLVGLVWLCAWVRLRRRWRAFIPGVLIGFGLTCLVPVGIVAVVCGAWHR